MSKLSIQFDEPNSDIPVSRTTLTNDGREIITPIEYVAEITAAKEDVSRKGSMMLVLTLSIYDEQGKVLTSFNEYIPYSMQNKLYRIVKMLGLNARNLFTEDFIGKYILVTLKKDKSTTSDLVFLKVDRYIKSLDKSSKEVQNIINSLPF